VISANGHDGNPDDAMLGLLCDARRTDGEPWTLWLTYGGEPNDGEPGLHDRLSAFLSGREAEGQVMDARFANPENGTRLRPDDRHDLCPAPDGSAGRVERGE
jgi:hypothetical protein